MGQDHIEWVFDDAKATIISRGNERDQPDGERTIPRCVTAFNAITGHKLSNTDGWLFMEILKKCRSVQGAYKYDDYRDGVGYAALRAEEARMEHEASQKLDLRTDLKRTAWVLPKGYNKAEEFGEFTMTPFTDEPDWAKQLKKKGIEAKQGQVFEVCKHHLIECAPCDLAFVPPECDNRGGA